MPQLYKLHRYHKGKRKFVGSCTCTAHDLANQLWNDFPGLWWTISADGEVTVY